MVGDDKLEVLSEFHYLSGMFFAWSGCELTAVTGCKCAWGKFVRNMFKGCEAA